MSKALAAVFLFAMACGGSGSSETGSLAGCWRLSLGGDSGEMHLTQSAAGYTGDFALGTQSGSAFGVVEPNGNFDVQLFTPARLIWDLSGPVVSDPLSGKATQQSQAPLALSAPRC